MSLLLAVAVLLLLGVGKAAASRGQVVIKTRGNSTQTFTLDNDKFFPNVSGFNVDAKMITEFSLLNSGVRVINVAEFGKMTNLERVEIVGNKQLRKLPAFLFKGKDKLKSVALHDNAIEYVSPDCFTDGFRNGNHLTTIDLRRNSIAIFPVFSTASPAVNKLVLDDNPITALSRSSLGNLTNLRILSMRSCDLRLIQGLVFSSNKGLSHLDMSGNRKLESIAKDAFNGLTKLKELYLDRTALTWFPSGGLLSLTTLSLKDTPNLYEIPDAVIGLPKLHDVTVDERRRYLCCAFEMRRAGILAEVPLTAESRGKAATTPVVSRTTASSPTTMMSGSTATTTEDPWGGFTFGPRKRRQNPLGGFGGEGFFTFPPSNKTTTAKTPGSPTVDPFGGFHTFLPRTISHAPVITRDRNNSNNSNTEYVKQRYQPVQCFPTPDALRPCDDIMGDGFLTGISLLVAVTALLSNGVVFGVLLSSRRTFTVTKLLIVNLAFADLCLGMYLFMLVCASLTTSGRYYNYVRRWQFDGGCDVAGFLAVFASQLSMLVLLVITIERYLAIVYAMYLNKRLTFGKTKWIITACWLFAFIIAILPVAGINGYQETAICLPFNSSTSGDITYLGLLLVFNCLVFLVILLCYIRMYWVVRAPHITCSNRTRTDTAVAKRMATLVVTDFLCWSPIALFGMLAASGYSEAIGLDVKRAKYLLVVFFPLNSICNPFLYAMSTNSFKRDFFGLLSSCGVCEKTALRYRGSTFTRASNGVRRSPRGDGRISRGYSETVTTDTQRKESRSGSIWAFFSPAKRSLSTTTMISNVRTPLPINLRMNSLTGNNPTVPELDDVFETDNTREQVVKFSDSPKHLSASPKGGNKITERSDSRLSSRSRTPELTPLNLSQRRSYEIDRSDSPASPCNSSSPFSADEKRCLFKKSKGNASASDPLTRKTFCDPAPNTTVEYEMSEENLAKSRESPLLT